MGAPAVAKTVAVGGQTGAYEAPKIPHLKLSEQLQRRLEALKSLRGPDRAADDDQLLIEALIAGLEGLIRAEFGEQK